MFEEVKVEILGDCAVGPKVVFQFSPRCYRWSLPSSRVWDSRWSTGHGEYEVLKGGALPLHSEAGVIWEAWSSPMQACFASLSCTAAPARRKLGSCPPSFSPTLRYLRPSGWTGVLGTWSPRGLLTPQWGVVSFEWDFEGLAP